MFEGLLQPTHLILVLVIVLIIFGPGKLPDIGKAIGGAVRDFRQASNPIDPPKNLSNPDEENKEHHI